MGLSLPLPLLLALLAVLLPTMHGWEIGQRRDVTPECRCRSALSTEEKIWFDACFAAFTDTAGNKCIKCRTMVVKVRSVERQDKVTPNRPASFSPLTDPVFIGLSACIIALISFALLTLLVIRCQRYCRRNSEKEYSLCLNETQGIKAIAKCQRIPENLGKLSGRSCKVSPHYCKSLGTPQANGAIPKP